MLILHIPYYAHLIFICYLFQCLCFIDHVISMFCFQIYLIRKKKLIPPCCDLSIFLLLIIEHFSFLKLRRKVFCFFPNLCVLHFRFPQNYPSSLNKKANSNISNGFSHSRPAFGKQQHRVKKRNKIKIKQKLWIFKDIKTKYL